MSFDPSDIIVDKVAYGVLESPGIEFVERRMVNIDNIYIRPIQDDNTTRSKGKDINNVEKLIQYFSCGIDYFCMPPVLIRIPPTISDDGNIKEFEILCGNHRLEAFRRLGYHQWVFDIYLIDCSVVTYHDAKYTFQLQENNHRTPLPASEDDVVKTVLMLIQKKSKLVEPETDSIWKYVNKYCSNMHYNTRAKVVRDIERNLQNTGCMPLYDVMTYTPDDVVTFINRKTDLVYHGKLDPKRDEHGWTMLEGYERKSLMQIMKKFSETGKTSYISLYTLSPTEDSSLSDRVEKMIETVNDLGFAILKCADHFKKHGKMPWYIKGRLPQDRAAGENEYIDMN